MSSKGLSVCQTLESLSIGPKLKNVVSELFIIRALLSALSNAQLLEKINTELDQRETAEDQRENADDQKEDTENEDRIVDFLMKKLVKTTLENLQPTQLCYALRGITETVELMKRKKIIVAQGG